MGSLLAQLFREKVAKDKSQKEADADVAYSTGFLPIDFLNGKKINTVKGDYYSVGLVDGKAVTFIGRTGCGKTSLALQIGANIIRPFPNAIMYYDDIEGGSDESRRMKLTGFGPNEIRDRIIYRNEGITAENFFTRICDICSLKLDHYNDFVYDTGLIDPLGDPIFKLQPTVYILDSLAMLTPDKLTEEEELSGQMSATSMAKTNTQVFKRIIPKLKQGNIILLVINHINDDVNINPYQMKKAQIGYLKQGETLPGGRAASYLANNMFRLDDNTKLKESEGLGIYGKIVDVGIVKSRTNAGGKSVPLIFDSINGFDPTLSLLLFLKSIKAVVAKGAYMVMVDYPDVKFSNKDFRDRLYGDPMFAKMFNEVCAKNLMGLIPAEDEYISYSSTNNLTDSILSTITELK